MKYIYIFIFLIAVSGLLSKNIYWEAAYQTDYIEEAFTHKTSVGFEFFKKFSNEYGDFLTADLQIRIPYKFEDDLPESLTLEVHNAWLEYKLGLGKIIRVGHFAPAFGTEFATDTHGKLPQTLAMKNVGFKQDWGIGYRSFFSKFDYAFAAQLGSGMAIREDSYLFTGRISSPTSNDFQYALSALYGKVHHLMSMATYPADETMGTVIKKRITAELQYNFSAYNLKNEISAGYNNDTEIISNFAEFEYKPFSLPNFNLIVQSKFFKEDDTKKLNWFSGASYIFFDTLTLSALYDITDEKLQFKLYYFG